jgi:hypothetical protein
MDQPANPEARNPSLNYQTGCLIVVDTFRALPTATTQGREALDHAVTVLAAVIWNIHLKRVLHAIDPAPRLNFWRLTYGNVLDMAVIEWCKLFGSDNREHQPVHWKNTIPKEEHDAFREGLLARLNVTSDDWRKYRGEVKGYRDNYVAHLSGPSPCLEHKVPGARSTSHYPKLGMALEASNYYYDELLSRLTSTGFPHHYPLDMREYCKRFEAQARKAAIKAIAATADMVEGVL